MKFVQLIEMRTTHIDEIRKLEECEKATEGKRHFASPSSPGTATRPTSWHSPSLPRPSRG